MLFFSDILQFLFLLHKRYVLNFIWRAPPLFEGVL